MSKINEIQYRKELATLVFDLDKFLPTTKSAEECVARLELQWINKEVSLLREKLKNVEKTDSNFTSVMENILNLQNRKKIIR